MATEVHLDTSALKFYQDAPDNYCHFVLGNLFEVFVGLSEGGVVGDELEITHNNPLPKFETHYGVFTQKPLRRATAGANGARSFALTESVDWVALEARRDLGHYLKGFQPFMWSRLNIAPEHARQVTLIRRNRVASNRYVVNEPQLMDHLRAECDKRGLTFEVVDFEGMPFERQVELMSRSRVLIGIHGAGLVNSMFLPPEAAIIELLPHRKFEALFFRWVGVLKGNRWVRVVEPSWSVPSFYNLILSCVRRGHTRTNRFFRDRNAVYEPDSIARALDAALDDSGTQLEIDITLTPSERSLWRKLALLRTHRKFLLGLALGGAAIAIFPTPLGVSVAVVLAALSFFT